MSSRNRASPAQAVSLPHICSFFIRQTGIDSFQYAAAERSLLPRYLFLEEISETFFQHGPFPLPQLPPHTKEHPQSKNPLEIRAVVQERLLCRLQIFWTLPPKCPMSQAPLLHSPDLPHPAGHKNVTMVTTYWTLTMCQVYNAKLS